ncbi:MAG TPA: ferrous iron transport protein B [Anaerolineales bacterium]|nr:ferrous iron transport protein B [Anaerolineales bacterium]
MQCHENSNLTSHMGKGSVALIGNPNVGKSVMFHRLTSQRVVVANYPGTTIELGRSAIKSLPDVELLDTPGVVAFPPHTEDEQVTLRVLFNEPIRALVQVGDAKNLRRTLLLTTQLLELGLPTILALNMMDEAKVRGVSIDTNQIAQGLGIRVVPTVAVQGVGLDEIIQGIQQSQERGCDLQYPRPIEQAIVNVVHQLPKHSPIAPRALALLWLSGDRTSELWLQAHLKDKSFETLENEREKLAEMIEAPVSIAIQQTRMRFVDEIVSNVLKIKASSRRKTFAQFDRLTTQPIWGAVILGVILYALYWFVGIFGAGTLVNLLEARLFGEILNPLFTGLVERYIPFLGVQQFIVGEYGLWTMGITYALALIMPIITTFFLAFGVLEDSGYLPRLVALSNRMFVAVGLNGRAVLPMVLGLGCVTMATMTTRVLESKRERLLVTLLLALAIPCSAQLGVVMGMLAGISLTATIIWGGVVFMVLLVVGWLAARLVPGKRVPLLTEMPPLRWPQVSNVVMKTLARLEWYIKEVVPLFLLGTALLFLLDKTGLLAALVNFGRPLVTGWLGLPPESSAAFLIGFLRRDFAATNLFLMESKGLLTPVQVVVAMVTITLFIPCIASVIMIAKERGWRTAAGMVSLVFPLAFLVGGLLNRILLWIGWGI